MTEVRSEDHQIDSAEDVTNITEAVEEKSLFDQLNQAFKDGKSIVEVSALLQQVHNPILVDFNGVLANGEEPVVSNPDALSALQELKKIGTVIILTTTNSWEQTHSLLENFGFWADDVVLITTPSYVCTAQVSETNPDPAMSQLRAEYTELAKQHLLFGQQQLEAVDQDLDIFWSAAPSQKRVAFVFKRKHKIPLIDDNRQAVIGNPGILGIRFKPWFAPGDVGSSNSDQHPGVGFAEALKIVREHYQNL